MADPIISNRSMSIEQYLELERDSPVRHEYVGGQLYAMTGTSKRHNRIAFNIARKLDDASVDTPCTVYMSDVKVRTPDDHFYYPDVMVSCEQESDDPYTEQAPCLLVEVTSPSSAATDRREKRLSYTTILSLKVYLVIDQERPRVEHHVRLESGEWVVTDYIGEGEFMVPCPSAHLTLRDIYAGVERFTP